MIDMSTNTETRAILIYLSGPMTGLPDFNYPAFDEAAAKLRALGYAVFNPTETFGRFQGLPKETYMAVDLAAVAVADMVVTLPGWEESEGANAEVARAIELGIPVKSMWVPTTRVPYGTRWALQCYAVNGELLPYSSHE